MIFWGSFRDHPVQVSKDHKVQHIITDMHAIQQCTNHLIIRQIDHIEMV